MVIIALPSLWHCHVVFKPTSETTNFCYWLIRPFSWHVVRASISEQTYIVKTASDHWATRYGHSSMEFHKTKRTCTSRNSLNQFQFSSSSTPAMSGSSRAQRRETIAHERWPRHANAPLEINVSRTAQRSSEQVPAFNLFWRTNFQPTCNFTKHTQAGFHIAELTRIRLWLGPPQSVQAPRWWI